MISRQKFLRLTFPVLVTLTALVLTADAAAGAEEENWPWVACDATGCPDYSTRVQRCMEYFGDHMNLSSDCKSGVCLGQTMTTWRCSAGN